METCPNCGEEFGQSTGGGPNSGERTITLEVPESHWPLFRLTFWQQNTKFGMAGQGSLANMLNPYHDQFRADFDTFRYFDDARIMMLYQVIKNGWPFTARIEPVMEWRGTGKSREQVHRTNAHDAPVHKVVFVFDLNEEGKPPVRLEEGEIVMSERAPLSAAEAFIAHIEDFAARVAPLDEETL